MTVEQGSSYHRVTFLNRKWFLQPQRNGQNRENRVGAAIKIDDESRKLIEKLGKARKITSSEALTKLVEVGTSRLKALKTYADAGGAPKKAKAKPKKAAGKPKAKAKVKAKASKAKVATSAASKKAKKARPAKRRTNSAAETPAAAPVESTATDA